MGARAKARAPARKSVPARKSSKKRQHVEQEENVIEEEEQQMEQEEQLQITSQDLENDLYSRHLFNIDSEPAKTLDLFSGKKIIILTNQ